jgi:16S rRNA (guanine966-N2)-methyltransferase
VGLSRSADSRRGPPRRGREVRPTSGLVREALFNILAGRLRLEGARVLDLFAGTGALGLEALRRGALFVIFVEHDRVLAEAIRTRGKAAGWGDRIELWRRDAVAAVHELGRTARQFDLILLDPPYGRQWIPKTLHAVAVDGILAPSGTVVAEGHWRDQPPADGLTCTREARYGETTLWFFEHAKEESPP